MTATYQQAKNEVLDEVVALMRSDAAFATLLVGNDPRVAWPDSPRERAKELETNAVLPWAQVTWRVREESIRSVGRPARWEAKGLLVVHLYYPGGAGGVAMVGAGTALKSLFRNLTTSPGGVILRNPRLEEIGDVGPWYRGNLLTEFEYDEVA